MVVEFFLGFFIIGIFTFLAYIVGRFLITPLQPTRQMKIVLAILVFLNIILLKFHFADSQIEQWIVEMDDVIGVAITFPFCFVAKFIAIPVPIFFLLNTAVWSALLIYLFVGVRYIIKKKKVTKQTD